MTQTVTYDARGQGVHSIEDNAAVYPLGDGKWMIPQHEFRACTQAAEDMRGEAATEFASLAANARKPRSPRYELRHISTRATIIRSTTSCVTVNSNGTPWPSLAAGANASSSATLARSVRA